jgi:predicted phage terminase large subunit-like protein
MPFAKRVRRCGRSASPCLSWSPSAPALAVPRGTLCISGVQARRVVKSSSEWWRYFEQTPESFKRRILSVDSAFKTGSQNDYTVVQHWGETPSGFYLLLNLRARMEFPELKRTLVSLDAQLHPDVVLVEDAGSGQSLLQELRASTPLPLIRPDRDKVSRATAASALVEAGRVHLPQPQTAAWVADFLDEVSVFPNAAHDDQVDALSTSAELSALRDASARKRVGSASLIGIYLFANFAYVAALGPDGVANSNRVAAAAMSTVLGNASGKIVAVRF